MNKEQQLPLKGLIVLEFSQYLSAPSAGLRLADLGARVIKIEHPQKGDACRKLAIKNLWVDDSSLLFHTINRNKESFGCDLKNPDQVILLKQLIEKADVITHNFRPGVMEKLGLDYESCKSINPRIIYATVSGYGKEGPWKGKPGQDLLIQSMSGLVYTSGNLESNPTPFGIAVADIMGGSQLVQGILAALIRRQKTGKGALVEISLMESILDFQFELLTTYFASEKLPVRSSVANAHPLLSAPYGIYATADGFIAIAMTPVQKLANIISCHELLAFVQEDAFEKRDYVKQVLSDFFKTDTTQFWLDKLVPHDIWCMPVLNWKEMKLQEAYAAIDMEQRFITSTGKEMITTRCPIRYKEQILRSANAAPQIGEHTNDIIHEFNLIAQ